MHDGSSQMGVLAGTLISPVCSALCHEQLRVRVLVLNRSHSATGTPLPSCVTLTGDVSSPSLGLFFYETGLIGDCYGTVVRIKVWHSRVALAEGTDLVRAW